MSYEAGSLLCCGIGEIQGLNQAKSFNPEGLFKWLANKYQYTSRAGSSPKNRAYAGKAAFIFTYAYGAEGYEINPCLVPNATKKECVKRTRQLREYINKNNLGKLKIISTSGNPNYEYMHLVRTMIFIPNHKGIFALVKKNKWENDTVATHVFWVSGS